MAPRPKALSLTSSRWTGATAVSNSRNSAANVDLEKGSQGTTVHTISSSPFTHVNTADEGPAQLGKAAATGEGRDASLQPPILLPTAIRKSGSVAGSTRRPKSARAQYNRFARMWANLKRRIGTATAPSSTSILDHSIAESQFSRQREGMVGAHSLGGVVDDVIVERDWSEDGRMKSSVATSEAGGGDNAQKSGSHPRNGTSVQDSMMTQALIRYRPWAVIQHFFDSRFLDEDFERRFQQEEWFSSKHLALWSFIWFILNWLLSIGLVSRPFVTIDRVYFYGIAPLLTIPLGFMILYNYPRDRPTIWSWFLVVSVWSWSIYYLLSIYLCGYYGTPMVFSCGTKDFLGAFYYNTALPSIAVFSLRLRRFPQAIGATVVFILTSVLITPHRTTWARLMVNFAFYHAFLLYVHYITESSARRLYILRSQLKKQYTATQKAQVNERKASDSKRRLTSYVFHEVRVPLNTALLAVQNMSAYLNASKDNSPEETAKHLIRDQEIEFNALVGSLNMMSKVLNDVLDFNRMDSGKFESVSRPYPFHQVMRSLFIPLQLATDARGLELITDLDENIDKVARKAAYEALGESEESIKRHIKEHPDVDGIVTGDETRLRQIITNLASNGCKFTKAGGKLIIRTKLIRPSHFEPRDLKDADISDDKEEDKESIIDSGINDQSHPDSKPIALMKYPPSSTQVGEDSSPPPSDQLLKTAPVAVEPVSPGLSKSMVESHNLGTTGKPPLEWIVVRIEVTDTGTGIAPSELVDGKLFSAFNQTEQGRQQGGKGTGLGLALVRQIVKLTGGRLGLKSKSGEGSTFWVELPLGVGLKAINPQGRENPSTTDLSKRVGWAKNDMDDASTTDTLMLLDSFAMKASRMSSSVERVERSSSALHGLMEHGGRVELTLSKTDSLASTMPTSHALADSMVMQQQQSFIGTPGGSIQGGSRISLSNSRPTLDARVSSEDTAVATPTPSKIQSPSQLPINALVVDDDPLTRMLMKRLLTRVGCRVYTAENGQIALDILLGTTPTPAASSESEQTIGGDSLDGGAVAQKGSGGSSVHTYTSGHQQPQHDGYPTSYGIVFLDNQMPVLSGIGAVAQLRAMGRNDFVVGVTGNALISDQEEYMAAGVDKVLTKPVLESQLKEVLVIARERQRKDLTPS